MANGLLVILDKHASDAWSRINVLGNVSVTKATATAVNSGLSIGTLTGVVDQNTAPVGTAHTSGAGWTAGTNFNV